jgi:hypothetical protein
MIVERLQSASKATSKRSQSDTRPNDCRSFEGNIAFENATRKINQETGLRHLKVVPVEFDAVHVKAELLRVVQDLRHSGRVPHHLLGDAAVRRAREDVR